MDSLSVPYQRNTITTKDSLALVLQAMSDCKVMNMRRMDCDRGYCPWTETHLINVTLRLLQVKITLAREVRMRLTGLVLLHKVTWAAAARVVLAVLLNATFPVACMLALLAACNSNHTS